MASWLEGVDWGWVASAIPTLHGQMCLTSVECTPPARILQQQTARAAWPSAETGISREGKGEEDFATGWSLAAAAGMADVAEAGGGVEAEAGGGAGAEAGGGAGPGLNGASILG